MLYKPVVVGEYTLPPLYVLAANIRKDWGKVHYTAEPYLLAMGQLSDGGGQYGMDSGDGIVRYFLANAGTYRGPSARENKAMLKAHAGIKLTSAEKELVQSVSYQLEESNHA